MNEHLLRNNINASSPLLQLDNHYCAHQQMATLRNGPHTTIGKSSSGFSHGSRNEVTLPEIPDPDATKSSTSTRNEPVKYRHVAAVHTQSRTSRLSSDSQTSSSFAGFRNLMVIVLGQLLFLLPSLLPLFFSLDCSGKVGVFMKSRRVTKYE